MMEVFCAAINKDYGIHSVAREKSTVNLICGNVQIHPKHEELHHLAVD